MVPLMVKMSLLLTVALLKKLKPGPARFRVFPLEPVSVVVREVVNPEPVEIVELLVTELVPERVTLPVASRVPPERGKALDDPPIREALSIERVPAVMRLPPV